MPCCSQDSTSSVYQLMKYSSYFISQHDKRIVPLFARIHIYFYFQKPHSLSSDTPWKAWLCSWVAKEICAVLAVHSSSNLERRPWSGHPSVLSIQFWLHVSHYVLSIVCIVPWELTWNYFPHSWGVYVSLSVCGRVLGSWNINELSASPPFLLEAFPIQNRTWS